MILIRFKFIEKIEYLWHFPVSMDDIKPKKSKDIPVTQEMLYEVRSELKSDITSVKLEVQSVKSELKSDIQKVNSDIQKVLSAVHRVTALVEEQDNRNKFALDGYAVLSERQDRLEKELRNDIKEIKNIIKRH